tara:strand:+ start:1759 stop:3792 length:2034 start_codon:yes stop_codon:yes gene_type:complete
VTTDVWLADLTHTGQSIASDAIPAAVGMIAEAVEEQCLGVSEIKLFKFPEILNEALLENPPTVIGFSNYVWNFKLSQAFGIAIKERHPDTVIVMGGPNFPSTSEERKSFLLENPWIDFYIEKEGEIPFVKLINLLITSSAKDMASEKVADVPNLCFIKDNNFYQSNNIERLGDLDKIQSPYLTGRLDSFLDGRLMPVIQTNRGCPFSCAFCTEGQGFWNKVKKKSRQKIGDEIRYIASALNKLPDGKKRGDLLIADSNFGMFPDDLVTCDVINEVQQNYNYPNYINVATGKNKKDRVLEAARRVNGAMKLAGSVQSLDPEVQEHMKRSNISAEAIVSLALEASEIGTNTYSEVILALPGDTKQKHYLTLKTLVDSDFSTVSMYQLMVLPGTEFGGSETKTKFEMKTKYRVVPRAFGKYSIFTDEISVAELEEICVQNKSLPYEDYLQCRRTNLMINIFFNDRVFNETLMVLRWCGISVFDFLISISESLQNQNFENFVQEFIDETEGELWNDSDSLTEFVKDDENISKFISGELGSNLIFKFKALSLTRDFEAICEALSSSIDELAKNTNMSSSLRDLIQETVIYKKYQVRNIFDDPAMHSRTFKYPMNNIKKFLEKNTIETIEEAEHKHELIFKHSQAQIEKIDSYKKIFGSDIAGLTRILTRARITEFYREVENA